MSIGRPPAREPGLSSAAKGALLVGLLVIVGIVGLQVLDDSSPSGGEVTTSTLPGVATTAPGTATTAAAAATTAPATTKVPTTTTVKTKKPADTTVMVFNASNVASMASNMSDKLKSVGYNVQGTGNITPERTGTTVSCRAGLDAEAAKLANNVGNGATVTAFPANPPKGTDGADCIVIIGKSA